VILLATSIASAADAQESESRFGVLIMAHGGTAEWNQSVREATAELAERLPLEIAFGMADAHSLQQAVSALEARAVDRIAVVRLFISGGSWHERTEQILGLKHGAPPAPPEVEHAHGGDGQHSMAFYRIDSRARFALSTMGLNEAIEVDQILADRAAALSSAPAREDVLVLAHGVGDPDINARWIELIDARTRELRASLPFRRVVVDTLSEDWEGPRQAAEARVREFVERAEREGGTAIVIPFRLSGFGPYAEVLQGLEYVADGAGLLPHAAISVWIERQADALRSGRFQQPLPAKAATATGSHH